jgi:hypothetical protein
MHDDCSFGDGGGDPVARGDAWLKTEVPKITTSAAFKNNGALFIVFDYGGSGNAGHLPFVVLSPLAKSAYTSPKALTHNSYVKSMAAIFGVAPFRNATSGTTDTFADLFTTFP